MDIPVPCMHQKSFALDVSELEMAKNIVKDYGRGKTFEKFLQVLAILYAQAWAADSPTAVELRAFSVLFPNVFP